LPGTTKRYLLTLPYSKGFFLAIIPLILYEAMVATLALLTGLENIALSDRKLRLKFSTQFLHILLLSPYLIT
jgi:hypothetical protein